MRSSAISLSASLLSRWTCVATPKPQCLHKLKPTYSFFPPSPFPSSLSYSSYCTVAKMRELDDEIQTMKATMSATPARIATLMKRERINATQVEDLMDIAKQLGFHAKRQVVDAYSSFYSSRGYYGVHGHQMERLDSLQEHNLKVIEIMTKLGRDTRMYTILIAAYALRGNAFRANSLLRAMKDNLVAPSSAIYNLLISLNGKEGDLDRCSALFDEMRLLGWEPNAKSWNTLLILNGRSGYIYKCARLYDEMKTKGIARYKSTYDVLLRIYGKKGLIKTCDKLVEEMNQVGVPMDTHTYNMLIDVRGNSDFEACRAMMATMREKGIARDVSTYTSFIQSANKYGKHEEGVEEYNKMKEEGITPNVLTYRAVFSSYAALKVWDQCLATIAEMEQSGVQFDERMYQMMLEVAKHMGDGKIVHELLGDMKKRKIGLDETTKKELMAAFEDLDHSEVLLHWEGVEDEEEAEEEDELDFGDFKLK